MGRRISWSGSNVLLYITRAEGGILNSPLGFLHLEDTPLDAEIIGTMNIALDYYLRSQVITKGVHNNLGTKNP